MSIDFTSGERRGLIALLAILVVVLCIVVFMRQCSSQLQSNEINAPGNSISINAADSTKQIFSTAKSQKSTNKRSSRTQRPDGPQRSFLDEHVDQ